MQGTSQEAGYTVMQLGDAGGDTMSYQWVYHGTSKPNLTELEPRPSTHGTFVYAAPELAIAACFLSDYGRDLSCQMLYDRESRIVTIVERYPGALEDRYQGASGSIYRLPGATFRHYPNTWDGEVMSPVAVRVEEEIRVRDALVLLSELERQGRIVVHRFPDTGGWDPDESKLVDIYSRWIRRGGAGAAIAEEFLRTKRPDLRDRVQSKLAESG